MIEEIDQQVGSSEQKVSCGQGAQAMVLNALGFSSRALYLMPDYMHNKPVDVLIGPRLVAEDFNDDSLGRSLDALYARGVTEVFARIATRALRVYGIEHRFVHVDSSSFHLHGQYEVEEPDKEVIHDHGRLLAGSPAGSEAGGGAVDQQPKVIAAGLVGSAEWE